MYKIGKTDRVTLEGRTIEIETQQHHSASIGFGSGIIPSYDDCIRDCPQGWKIPSFHLLYRITQDPQLRKQLGLEGTCEYVQSPDEIPNLDGSPSGFDWCTDYPYIFSNGFAPPHLPQNTGVRYVREIHKKNE